MATHSSVLAWKIPWMEEPGRLQSMGSQRIKQDLSDFTMCVCIYICICIQYKYTHLYLYRHPFQNFCILAWKILRMEEPGRLQSMGSQRIEQDLSNFMMCVCTYICVQYKYTHLYLYRHPFQNFCILIDIFYMKGHYSLGIFQFFRYDLH